MARATPIAYNTGNTISNTQQIGSLAIATGNTELSNVVTWYNGPDEELGYVIAVPVSGGTQPTPNGVNAFIGFYRSKTLTDPSFISLAEFVSKRTQTFASGFAAKTWLNNNGYWTSYTATTPTINAKVEASYGSSSYYLHSDGTLYSWGENSFGQLGDNTTVSKRTPVAVCGGLTYKDINAGPYHFLGVTTTGVGYGWGLTNINPDWVINSNAIGNNVSTGLAYSTPVAICGGLTFSQITAGQNFSLGLTTGGIGYGWGENFDNDYARGGQLGIDSTDNKITPVAICGGLTFSQISAGRSHSLGLTTSGIAYVWGWGFGLGNNTNPSEFQTLYTPTAVCGGLTFSQISAGLDFSLGITTSGVAYSWGDNSYGQLGVNDTSLKPTPVAVCGGLTFCQVSAGVNYSLGITTNGIAYAWGRNDFGQLGDNTTVSKRTPVAVCGGLTFSQVSAGVDYSLGITTTGFVYAWGLNISGQLGDNTTTSRLTPVAVCPKW